LARKNADHNHGEDVLPTVLTRTRFGEDWQLRLALAVALGFCLLVQGVAEMQRRSAHTGSLRADPRR
jgi:hypothetical protein